MDADGQTADGLMYKLTDRRSDSWTGTQKGRQADEQKGQVNMSADGLFTVTIE